MPLLELKNISKFFGSGYFAKEKVCAVRDLSLSIAKDQGIVAIVGESGSGKSTLAMMALGILQPSAGAVLYKGVDIKDHLRSEKKEFRREVQAVLQDPFAVYNPFYKVDHLLTVPIKKYKLAKTKKEATAKIEEAFASVGLNPAEILGRYPHQLSGGQRQRIAVARAMLLKPEILIADEPVSMVDASLRAIILNNLQGINKKLGTPIVYITHDLTTAYQVSNFTVIMKSGEIVESGETENVIKNPKHPYTKLLLDSIPWIDSKKRWVNKAK